MSGRLRFFAMRPEIASVAGKRGQKTLHARARMKIADEFRAWFIRVKANRRYYCKQQIFNWDVKRAIPYVTINAAEEDIKRLEDHGLVPKGALKPVYHLRYPIYRDYHKRKKEDKQA